MLMQEPQKYLSSLGLSDSEVTVYLAMITGARTARELIKITSLKRPTVYYALSCLEKRSLISKSGQEGDKRFSLEPLQRLSIIAEEKSTEAVTLKNNINELIVSLASVASTGYDKPKVAYFEGPEAVKRVIMDMLYCKSKKLSGIVPQENFFWQVGKEFVALFVEERKRNSITAKNLWEVEIDKKLMRDYYSGTSEVRIVPAVMRGKFESTIFLYDDKTLYISSLKNGYCVLITSKEHHDTMQALFDGLWSVSKPHKK